MYRKTEDIVSRKIADEFILVPIRNNVGDLESIYTLNETAARIWDLIDGKHSVLEIKALISREFEAAEPQVSQDVSGFVAELERMGFIKNNGK